ncbi:hypothetical protein [Microvirga sp. M2]|uniref:hypothetical protein n=1 Tax=Microvirga sp. M2 TaxID=3073270 RepID=UPI0039C221C4
MRRHILGVLTATTAAPYLVLFLWSLFGLLSGDQVGMKEPLDLLKVIPLGTLGVGMFGIPLLILASLCAMAVNVVRRPTWRGSVLGGITLSLGFTAAHSADDGVSVPFLMSGALSGAISGWIYWRIAMRPRQTVEPPPS